MISCLPVITLDYCKQVLLETFEVKDPGEASFILGIELHKDGSRGMLGLSQRAYIDQVLKRFNIHNCSPGHSPIIKLTSSLNISPKNELEKEAMKQIPCTSTIKILMYAQLYTRLDIVYAVSLLRRSHSNPGMDHWEATRKLWTFKTLKMSCLHTTVIMISYCWLRRFRFCL